MATAEGTARARGATEWSKASVRAAYRVAAAVLPLVSLCPLIAGRAGPPPGDPPGLTRRPPPVVAIVRVQTYRVGGQPCALALWPGGRRLLAAVPGKGGGHLLVLGLPGGALIQTLTAPVACMNPQVPPGEAQTEPQALLIAPTVGRAFVAETRERVAVFSYSAMGTLHLVRTVAVGGTPLAIAADRATGRVFVSTTATHAGLAVLDLRTGALLHTVAAGPGAGAVAVDERAGRVYVAEIDGHVDVLDAHVGRLVARPRNHGPALAVTADALHSRAWALNSINRGVSELWTLDATTGRILHSGGPRFPQANAALASAVGANRLIIVTTPSGYQQEMGGPPDTTVHLLDARTQQEVHSIVLGRGSLLAMVALDTRRVLVVVADDGPQLSVLDERTGIVQARATIPAGPHALVVDESTGQIIVAAPSAESILVLPEPRTP